MENRWKGMIDDMFNPEDFGMDEINVPFEEGDDISIVSIHLGHGEQTAVLNVAVNLIDFEEFARVLNYNKLPYTVQHLNIG